LCFRRLLIVAIVVLLSSQWADQRELGVQTGVNENHTPSFVWHMNISALLPKYDAPCFIVFLLICLHPIPFFLANATWGVSAVVFLNLWTLIQKSLFIISTYTGLSARARSARYASPNQIRPSFTYSL
jgi:hypothetical protein